MFSDIKFKWKLPFLNAGSLFLLGMVLTTDGILGTSSGVTEQAETKLEAIQSSRSSELLGYLNSISEDLDIAAKSPYTYEALLAFKSGWDKMGDGVSGQLMDLYIDSNPHPLGEKDKLYDAEDGSDYSNTHRSYHPWFHNLQQKRGYYDVFLVEPGGELIYSVFKERDYATNLSTGKYASTDIGNVFRDAVNSNDPSQQYFYDFRPYAPSADAPASFMAQQVVGPAGDVAGVLIFQMPIDRINGIMQKRDGMGESGESYLVGIDKLMRSDSRFSEESTILKTRIDGETVDLALRNQKGVKVIDDYRGIPVFFQHMV